MGRIVISVGQMKDVLTEAIGRKPTLGELARFESWVEGGLLEYMRSEVDGFKEWCKEKP